MSANELTSQEIAKIIEATKNGKITWIAFSHKEGPTSSPEARWRFEHDNVEFLVSCGGHIYIANRYAGNIGFEGLRTIEEVTFYGDRTRAQKALDSLLENISEEIA